MSLSDKDNVIASPADDEYQKWEMPQVLGKNEANKLQQVTAAELESIQEQAYREAHEQGYNDGFNKGLTDSQDRIQKKISVLENCIAALIHPFENLDNTVVEQVTELALSIAKQVIRRELNTSPDQVVAVVREAMAVLPVASSNISIHLHPEDASLVRQAFTIEESQSAAGSWKIIDDPVLLRGDCMINTDDSNIDATLETRLNRMAASILGGEREGDKEDARA